MINKEIKCPQCGRVFSVEEIIVNEKMGADLLKAEERAKLEVELKCVCENLNVLEDKLKNLYEELAVAKFKLDAPCNDDTNREKLIKVLEKEAMVTQEKLACCKATREAIISQLSSIV